MEEKIKIKKSASQGHKKNSRETTFIQGSIRISCKIINFSKIKSEFQCSRMIREAQPSTFLECGWTNESLLWKAPL